MKNIYKICLLAALAATLLTGCINSGDMPLREGNELRISGYCGDEGDVTRAKINDYFWEPSDKIGVFCTTTGKNNLNVPYVLDGDSKIIAGTFKFDSSSAAEALKISFDNDKTYNIYAYYPFEGTAGSNPGITVDCSNQRDTPNLLTASVTEHSGKNSFVNLRFRHALSKLVVEFSSDDYLFDNTIKFYISGLYVTGTANADGNSPINVVPSGNKIVKKQYFIPMIVGEKYRSRTLTAYFPPQENAEIKITVEGLTNDSGSYSGEITLPSVNLRANEITTLNLSVEQGGKITLNSATISDWTNLSQTIIQEIK